MEPDNEQDEIDGNRREIDFKVERFREQSQFYLKRLPMLKRQLTEINRLNQFDLYVQKLNEIGKIVQDLVQNLRNLEVLNSRLNETDRKKIEEEIRFLRVDVDREMTEFHQLRDEAMITSRNEEVSTTNDDRDVQSPDPIQNELRHRKISSNFQLNDSYDSVEQDLIVLRDTISEVAKLVSHQRQTILQTEDLIHSAQTRIQNATTLLQKAVQNKYVSIASGALLGATLGGPVGFLMGVKVGALAALSGSAVAALSVNLMQQRANRHDETHQNSNAYNQAML